MRWWTVGEGLMPKKFGELSMFLGLYGFSSLFSFHYAIKDFYFAIGKCDFIRNSGLGLMKGAHLFDDGF
jgi:hypothetical protein